MTSLFYSKIDQHFLLLVFVNETPETTDYDGRDGLSPIIRADPSRPS
jgi:hypothetical protein